jgi:hypothetical protein
MYLRVRDTWQRGKLGVTASLALRREPWLRKGCVMPRPVFRPARGGLRLLAERADGFPGPPAVSPASQFQLVLPPPLGGELN